MTGDPDQRLSDLQPTDHACLVYDDVAQAIATAAAFLKQGLDRGERCLYVTGEHPIRQVADALCDAGVDVPRERERAALILLPSFDADFPSGEFDPEAMIAFLRQLVDRAVEEGYSGLRIAAEMTWTLGAEVIHPRLVRYEALVNKLFANSPLVAICLYNRHRFAPAALHDVLRTHPLAIVDGHVCANFYYEPSELVLNPCGVADRVDWMLGQLRRAQLIGERAALAIEKERLHEEERRARAEAETAQKRLAFLASASTLLAGSLDYEATLAQVARLAVPFLADWCAVDVVGEVDDSGTLPEIRQMGVAHVDPPKEELVREGRRRYPLAFDASHPIARVIRTGQAEIVADVPDALLRGIARDEAHLDLLRTLGVRSYMVVPLIAHGRTLGAITFVSASERRYDPASLSLAEDLARRCALAVDNARLYSSAQAARAAAETSLRRQRFLAEAGRLLASSLDPETTLARVADLAIPTLADWSVVDLVDKTGGVKPVAVSHVDPAKVAVIRELRAKYPPDLNRPYGLGKVLRSGEAERYEEIRDEWRVAASRDAEHLRLMRELGARSSMTVPLRARGRTIGAMTLVAAESGRRYGTADVALAVELANRCALAVDNALLHQGEQEARHRLQEFVAMVAHDLGTPLTTVLGYAQALRRTAAEHLPRSGQRAVQVVEESAQRMRRLLDDLKDVAQVGSGAFRVEPIPMDLVAVARQVVEEQRVGVEEHQLVLDAPEPLKGTWDRERLAQVLTNLVSNAIKYSPNGGEVQLTTRRVGDEVVVRVSDQGAGMTPEELKQLFQPFGRLERDRKRGIAGSGLGLYICKGIVEAHGGRIWVESEPGKGSTFFVALPLHVKA